MSFYPCFWAVLLLTSSGCVALDGVELLKKWAENMKVVIFSARVSIFWMPYVLHTSVAPHRCSCR